DGDLDPHAGRRLGEGDADQQQPAASDARLGGGVHPHEEVRQAQHADGSEKAQRRAGDEEKRGKEGCHHSSSSLIDPRSMKPAKATAARKPTSATPSAMSMKAAEPEATTAMPAPATPRMPSMSSATTRSGPVGPRTMRLPAQLMAASSNPAAMAAPAVWTVSGVMAAPPSRSARSRP